jgi:hypothetical protein
VTSVNAVPLHSLRWRLVDRPGSVGDRMRTRRAGWLTQQFPDLAEMSVIDLGGRASSWLDAPVRPKHVHIVNLEGETGLESAELPPWAEVDYGDACNLPAAILGRTYDLVFCNSVLEHVGGHERRLRLADAVHKLAPSHWVQTPYRYFPVEPHWLFPFLQFLTMGLRARVAAAWPLAHTKPGSAAQAMSEVQWTELIGVAELRAYFPGSRILRERALGITKSIVAVADGT